MENVTLVGPGPVAVSDGPGDYVDDMECTWIINSSGPIAIVFKAFATEQCCDFLTISDGTSGDLLGNFSGETLPKVLSTNATSLQVVFKSDFSSSSAGFELEAFALVPGGTWAPTGTPTALPTWAPTTATPTWAPTTATPTWAPDTTGVALAMILCTRAHAHAHEPLLRVRMPRRS